MYRLVLFFIAVPSLLLAQPIKNTKIMDLDTEILGGVDISLNKKDNKNIVAVANNSMFTSLDGGATWLPINVASSVGFGGDPTLACDRKGNFYYLHISKVGDDGTSWIVCHHSKDGGRTWSEKGILGNRGKYAARPRMVIDRSGELFVTWIQYDKYRDSSQESKSYAMFSRTKDGKKWDDSMILNQIAGNCANNDKTIQRTYPGVNIDGQLFAMWSYDSKIFMDRSFDKKGGMWLSNDLEATKKIGGWSMNVSGVPHAGASPVMKIDNSDGRFSRVIYLCWSDHEKEATDGDIFFSRSIQFGDSWESPIKINQDASGKEQFLPAMSVDNMLGNIYILYYDRREHDDDNTDVYLAYSADNSVSFKEIKVSNESFLPSAENFPVEYIGIDAYQGTIVMAWVTIENGKLRVMSASLKHDDLVKNSTIKTE